VGKDNEDMATNTKTTQFIILRNNDDHELLPVNTTTEVAAAAAAVARAGLAWVPVWSGDGVKTDLKIFAEGDGGVTFSAYSARNEPMSRLTAVRSVEYNWMDCDSHVAAAAAAARANALPGWARAKLVHMIWEDDLDVEEALNALENIEGEKK
jgi:hypothetical protein